MVGPRELESLTSCVSSRRSNQLSYGPGNRVKTQYDMSAQRFAGLAEHVGLRPAPGGEQRQHRQQVKSRARQHRRAQTQVDSRHHRQRRAEHACAPRSTTTPSAPKEHARRSSRRNPAGKGMPMKNAAGEDRGRRQRHLRRAEASPRPRPITGDAAKASAATSDRDRSPAPDQPAVAERHQPAAEEASHAARNQHGEHDHRQRVRRMPQQQDEVLDQRHLNQNVARAEAQKIQQEHDRPPFCFGNVCPAPSAAAAASAAVAPRLTPSTPNSSGTARLTL